MLLLGFLSKLLLPVYIVFYGNTVDSIYLFYLSIFYFIMFMYIISDAALAQALRVSALEANQRNSDNQTYKERLLKNMDAVNLVLRRDVPGDGNCFYYCILDQMERLKMDSRTMHRTAATLRMDVASFLANLVSVIIRRQHLYIFVYKTVIKFSL